jgi:hypothetical protein
MKTTIVKNFSYDYSKISEDEFYENLPSQLQNKLSKFLLKEEKKTFKYLFTDKHGFKCNSNIVNQLLSAIICNESFDSNLTVKKGEAFQFFYLLKSGLVKIYDRKFNYMYDLADGGFFGEYNLMFNLCSEFYY